MNYEDFGQLERVTSDNCVVILTTIRIQEFFSVILPLRDRAVL